MIRELIQTVKFLEPWQFALLAMFVQIGLLVGLAWLVYRRLDNSPREQHFVWLAALLAIGCSLPLQLLLPGWTFQVERTAVNVGSDDSNSEFNSGVSDKEFDSASSDSTSTESNSIDLPFDRRGTQSEDNVVNDSGNSNEVNSELAIDSSSLNDVEEKRESSLATTEASRHANLRSGKRSWLGLLPDWKVILAGIYLMAFAWMLLRLLCGWWLLKSITGKELNADGRHGQLIDRVANRAQLKSVPQVLVSPDVNTPMAYGIRRPVVLLPQEFRTWNRECQEVVLSHEFCHIQRRDAVWDLISRLISALYWFHPAVHFASQSLRKTRETATDLAVLNLGIAPTSYARELLNVTAANRSAGSTPRSVPVLRMAGEQDFEARVKRILRSPLAGQRNRSGGISAMFHLGILTLFFVVIGTSLKMTIANVMIQEEVASSNQSMFPQEVDNEQVSGADFYTTVSRTRVRERDSEAQMFTISGTINDSSNQPVENAIVVLRNASALGSSRGDRINFVLGKTRTDDQGKYSIVAADLQGNYVTPELSAFTESGLIGWARIHNDQLQSGTKHVDLPQRSESAPLKSGTTQVDLKLSESVSVRGRLVSESGDPIANMRVVASSFRRQNSQGNTERVEFHERVIAPFVMTDENGEFEFPALPANFIAVFQTKHPEYADSFICVRSSGDHPLWLTWPGREKKTTVFENGATQVVKRGVSFKGTVVDVVGSEENPRANVWVDFMGQTKQTGTDGKFEILITEERLALREKHDVSVYCPGTPHSRYKFPVKKPGSEEIVLRLTEPADVSGTVLASDDKVPVAGVRMLISSSNGGAMIAVTDDQGRYKMVIPAGEVTVKVDGTATGFKTLDRNRNTLEDKPGPLMREFQMEVAESRELEPFLLERLEVYEAQIVDESGDPVSGAEVTLYSDEGYASHQINSDVEVTLQDGLVDLVPLLQAQGESTIVARYEKDGQLFIGHAIANKETTPTQLQILPATEARGKVTLNGDPLRGVKIQVTSKTNGRVKSSWTVGSITTDENGEYKIAVPQLNARGGVGEFYIGVRGGIPNDLAFSSARRATLNGQGVYEQDFAFFEGPRTITGTVIDSNGDPVVGLCVALGGASSAIASRFHSPDRHYQPSQVYTDQNGKFTLTGLEEDAVIPLRTGFWGEYWNEGEKYTGRGEQKLEVAADETEVQITLELF